MKGKNRRARAGNAIRLQSLTDDPTTDASLLSPLERATETAGGSAFSAEETGSLSMKRMETIDEKITRNTLECIDNAHKSGNPFFVLWNTSRMHIWTHLKPESQGKTGLGTYPDGMVEHDGQVGEILRKLDELGIADNTIVMYSTDNGAESMSWPDGGTTIFRGEKNTNWEGGYRVPCFIRWSGVIKPGTTLTTSARTKTCSRRYWPRRAIRRPRRTC